MPAPSVPCPSCGRRVASGRTECAACGAALGSTGVSAGAVTEPLADGSDAGTDATASRRERARRPKAKAIAPQPVDALAVPAAPPTVDALVVPAAPPTVDALVVPAAPPPVDASLAALAAVASPMQHDGDPGDESRLHEDQPPVPVRRAGAYLPPSTSSTSASRGPAVAVAASAARPFAAAPSTWTDRRSLIPGGAPFAAAPTVGTYVPAPMQAAFGAASGGVAGPLTATAAPASGDEALLPGHASIFADLPFDAPDDLPGWLVAIGSIGATLSFLFPWAPEVLGSPSLGTGYFSQWGLASPMHLPPLLFIVALAALAVVPNRVPTWLRTGILPVLAGGSLLGLTWPYLVGGFGGLLGTTVAAAAAILMVVGGGVALAPRGERQRAD